MKFTEGDKVKYKDGKMLRYGKVVGAGQDLIDATKYYYVEFTYYTYPDKEDMRIYSRTRAMILEEHLMEDRKTEEDHQKVLDRLGVLHQYQIMAVNINNKKWFEEVGIERKKLELSLT